MRESALLVLVGLLAAGVPAQPRLKSGTELVHVDVTVTDALGRMVTGLPREAFEVSEDGRRQEIVAFSDLPVPTSVLVLLDVSGSMRGPRYEAALAALDALGEALDPDDRWSVVAFNHTTQVIVGWSEPSGQVTAALRRSGPGGGTRLFEAIKDSVRSLEPSPTRKRAIVAITDGNDQSSTAGGSASTDASLSGFDNLRDDEGGAVKALRSGEALLYAVGMDWPYEKRGPPPIEYRGSGSPARSASERVDIVTLTRLAAPTGGAAFLARTSESLRNTAEQIVAELHQQYTLGYVPPKPADGKIHRITVTTRDPEHRVRARTAYLAKK